MDQNYPKIGIVILNYATYKLTLSLIKNIRETLTYPNIEIIVVDNASKNESGIELQKAQLSNDYTFIQSKVNGGYAKGNNIGILKAVEIGCEYILITNNDIEFIDSKTLDILIKTFRSNPQIGVITPALIAKNNISDPPIYFKRPSFWDFTLGSYSFHKKRFLLDTDSNYPIYAPRGSCMLLKTGDFKEIGYFDDATFLYFEEPILAERLKKINKISYFCGEVKVIHNHGKTISTTLQQNKTLGYMSESFGYYLKAYRNYTNTEVSICKFFRKLIYCVNRRLKPAL